jgi:DNA-binding NarL/FixJ family response regulator
MLSTNNNDYNYIEREKKVLKLYDQGKSNRDIAKELRMSLRDISSILRKNHVSHGVSFPIIDNDSNNNTNKTSLL